MLTTAQFLRLKPASIAVYGVNGGAIATDIYLRKLGLHNHLACFLSTAANLPAQFCGKPTLPPAILRKNPDMVVITADLDFNAVHNALRHAGIINAFYYHASFWPWLDDDPQQACYNFTRQFYQQDDHRTVDLMKTIFNLRLNSSLCRIQPYETVKDIFYTQDTYWLESRILPEESLTIIDAGAFDGDTMQSLFKTYGERIKRYYALDPVPHIFPKLLKTAETFAELAQIECLNIAFDKENTQKALKAGVPRSSRISAKGDIMVNCRRLDDLNLKITGKACLKMDIEGMELEALAGAAEFIKTHKPHLALCLYHKTNDIYKIPQYIKSLVPEYEFTMAGGVHTLCYGSVKTD